MTTEPFKRGEKVWYGEWVAGEFHRVVKATVVVTNDCRSGIRMDGENWISSVSSKNLERIHNDLNERLK